MDPQSLDPAGVQNVLKVIRKLEVQVLCSQHNPAIAEQKKAQKQDKIRNELLLLPEMSRIKIRVSAGVFEVSLLRVIDESKSVEVLWDRGVKREFKWGSVVFGNIDGQTVGQKPTELASDASSLATQSVMSFPPPAQRPRQSGYPYTPPNAGQYHPQGSNSYYNYQPPPSQSSNDQYANNPYLYAGYSVQNFPAPPYQYNTTQYRTPPAGLQWQQPYKGPAQATQYRVGTVATDGTYKYAAQPPPASGKVEDS